MKRGFLIFNPSAGTRLKTKALLAGVIHKFKDQRIEVIPSPTEAGGSVLAQVRDLLQQSPDLLVAWGGDGTINEVVNGMFGSPIPLGVIAGGTANLFVRELKLPTTLSGAIKLIGQGKTRHISVGQANDRYFVLMVGIGLDSEVIRNVSWSLKKRLGKLAFCVSLVTTVHNYSFPQFTIRVDGQEKECVFAVVCNAREYGAYFVLTPDANISDDYFYICLFKEPGVGSMYRYVFHALSGTHGTLDSVEIFRARELEVFGANTIAVQADGELVGFLPMKFQIHPNSLNVFCP